MKFMKVFNYLSLSLSLSHTLSPCIHKVAFPVIKHILRLIESSMIIFVVLFKVNSNLKAGRNLIKM